MHLDVCACDSALSPKHADVDVDGDNVVDGDDGGNDDAILQCFGDAAPQWPTKR